eukprot:1485203-Rhodomonas_salina.2
MAKSRCADVKFRLIPPALYRCATGQSIHARPCRGNVQFGNEHRARNNLEPHNTGSTCSCRAVPVSNFPDRPCKRHVEGC